MGKAWLNEYPSGVPPEISLPIDETILSLYERSYQRYPDRNAFSCQGSTLTYQELHALSVQFAAYLQQELHLMPGDRVALMLPNLLQYPVSLLGVFQAGGVVVNLNPLEKAKTLVHELSESGAKVIVVSENFVGELRQIIDQTAIEKIIITSVGSLYHPLKRLWINFVVRHIKKMVPDWHHPRSIHFREALKIGQSKLLRPVKVKPEDLAFLQYTGGTTGLAKGVELTHRNIVANAYQCLAWIKPYLTEEPQRVITALPLYHVFSLMANCMVFILMAGECILIPNPRDISGLVRVLKKSHFTAFTGVNTLFNALLRNPQFRRLSFANLKITLGGGMAVQPHVAEDWRAVTGCVLSQGYGLTEASPVLAITPLHLPFNGSAGLPISSTELSIQDPEGHILGPHERGEICARGPQVMRAYWKAPLETQKVLSPEGWLRTGDEGYLDERGYLFIVDRLKDMIVVSGFKVYSLEVEEVIAKFPGVREVAVIGVPDPDHGEVVKAFVVKDPKSDLTEVSIIEACHRELLPYKCPKQVAFETELPKSLVGKILKKNLKTGVSRSSN